MSPSCSASIRQHRSLVWLALAGCSALLLLCAVERRAFSAEQDTPEAAALRRNGISPDAAGVANYLDNLYPSSKLQERIKRLIADLGNNDFYIREAASRELSGIGAARGALTAAQNSDDLEIQHRAKRILDTTASNQESLLLSALRLVTKKKLSGLAPHLIRAMPLCQKEYVYHAAALALATTARPEDEAALRKAMASDDLRLRTAAIVALQASGAPALETIRPLLKAKEDAIRMAAVEALVNQKPQECLAALVSLLESDQTPIRARSHQYLRRLTGQQFGYIAGSDDEVARRKSVAQWRKWIEGPGRTASLHVPLPASPPNLGRTLVCLFNNGAQVAGGVALGGRSATLVEIDDKDRVKDIGADGVARVQMPFGCQGLADGHRLFCDLPSQTVTELDADGKSVWQTRTTGGPASVERLENGNTLVAMYQSRQVVELAPNGSTPWKIDVGGMVSDAHALENGNVLVVLTDQGRVAEFDHAGKQVWKIDGLPNPWSARRSADGNTLVACYGSGKVMEYNSDGGVVWSVEGVPNCFDAVALENGNILIGYMQGLREVDRQGKTVKERPLGMVRRISVF